jgi:hypothetical protein
MGVAFDDRAAVGRWRNTVGATADSPSIDPSAGWIEDASFDRCPEIDCIRAMLSATVIEAAELRAARLGVGADRVLIASGQVSEETYLRAFASSLGVHFEPLDGTPREFCPLDDRRLIESAAAGMLPLAIDDELYLVVAPRGGAARQIQSLIDKNPARAARFRFTSAERLNRFVLRHGGATITARAAEELKQTWPMLSAAPPRWRTNIVPIAIATLLAVAAAIAAPTLTTRAVEIVLAVIFLAWLGLRLTGAFVKWLVSDETAELPDHALPVYTIIAALYREAGSVDGLLNAFEHLDYPGIMAQAPQGGPNHGHSIPISATY